MNSVYAVRAAAKLPELTDGWNHPAWGVAETAQVSHFRPESSAHRPRVAVRLLHGRDGIRGIFHLDDRYVRSIRTNYGGEIWNDSCVECFLQPKTDFGYFNLEMNAGGAHLCCFIEDPTRIPDGFKKFTPLPADIGGKIQVRSTLPQTVDPEISIPVEWELNFFLPFAVLEKYVGPLGKIAGQNWRGNFYKCGDELSHPHWAAWSPVDELNFHLPRCFGTLQFE